MILIVNSTFVKLLPYPPASGSCSSGNPDFLFHGKYERTKKAAALLPELRAGPCGHPVPGTGLSKYGSSVLVV